MISSSPFLSAFFAFPRWNGKKDNMEWEKGQPGSNLVGCSSLPSEAEPWKGKRGSRRIGNRAIWDI